MSLVSELKAQILTHLNNTLHHEDTEQLDSEPLSFSPVTIQLRECHQYMIIYKTVSPSIAYRQCCIRTNNPVEQANGNYRTQCPEGIPEYQISVLKYA